MDLQMTAKSLYEAFKAGTELNPDAPAILYKGKTVLHKELSARIDRLALVLSQNGVKAGDIVSISLPNMPKTAALLYAINKIGAVAYLQHALNSPAETLRNLEKTNSKLLFALDTACPPLEKECFERGIILVSCCPADELGAFIKTVYRKREGLKHPRKSGGKITDFNDFLKDSERFKAAGEPPALYEWNLEKTAVMIDSGGTTGVPKTVELSAPAINKLGSLSEEILQSKVTAFQCMMSPLPVFHSYGLTMGLHAMFMHGGCNALMPKFSRKDAIRYLKKGKIDYMIGVPAVFDALLSMPEFRGQILRKVDSVFVGGDDLSAQTREEFDKRMAEAGARARLFQGWGLSETLSVACVNTHAHSKPGSIGKPLRLVRVQAVMTDGAKAFLQNKDFDGAVPQDARLGELCVSGEILFNGYFNDPQATAATFFTDDSGTRWLKTGDLGYIDSEGFVFFLDRMKNVIKVSGESIFPSEVENFAVTVPGVKIACAFAVPDKRAGSRVRLAIEPAEDFDQNTIRLELETLLNARLHKNAVPVGIDFYKELPRTKMMKIDVTKLTQGVPN